MDARLNSIADFVPRGSRVADIGTDHAQLAIDLIKSGRASFVVATDKNAGPLDAAINNIVANDLAAMIDTRLGDGLNVLRAGEVDTVCIAGMGGTLICDILNASPNIVASIERLILQPMNATDRVRQWIDQNNWRIVDEDLAEVSGIIYEIICAVNDRSFNPTARLFKRDQSLLLKKFFIAKLEQLQRTTHAMEQSAAAVQTDKYRQLQDQIADLVAKIAAL